MKKNSIKIKEFINRSIGEWKSSRSTHTLAFNEFENTNSDISISFIAINDKRVEDLLVKFEFNNKPAFAVSITWQSRSDWTDEVQVKKDRTIIVFLPKDENSGILLRNKGYVELIHSHSDYRIDNNFLTIKTTYNSTMSEEKLWFLSNNVRTRHSVIRSKDNDSIIQTSHTSEIRRLFI